MEEEMVPASAHSGKVIEALIEVLKTATSPEMMEAQQILMRRLALSGDVVPSRIPAPKNVTEVGGYLNLLETLDQPEMRAEVLASILGVAGHPPLGLFPAGAVLFYATRPNDRPAGPQQETIPVEFSVRSDFATAFDAAIQAIHDRGCQLPILSPVRSLPSASGAVPPSSDLLRYLGRTLNLVPSAALIDPDADPLALARPEAGGELQVVARQLDTSAPNASDVPTESWVAFQCDDASCQETTADRTYLPLASILNAAGWYQPVPTAPESLSKPGIWARWTNVTALVAGVTVYGDELGLLHTQAEIAASSLRERVLWVWNGTEFAPPGS